MLDEQVTSPITQVTEEPTGTDQVKTDKVFTQNELDAAIKTRLEREKVSNKKAVESVSSEKERLTTELEQSNILLGKYREVFAKEVSAQIASLPDMVKELVLKLDPLDRLEWLKKNSKQFAKQGVSAVPDGNVGEVTMEQLIARKKASGIY